MTSEAWVQLIIQGGAIVVLSLIVLWSREGTIRWGKTTTEQIDAKDKQLTEERAGHAAELMRLQTAYAAELTRMQATQAAELTRMQAEKDKLWKHLERSTGLAETSAAATVAAAHLVETLPPPK